MGAAKLLEVAQIAAVCIERIAAEATLNRLPNQVLID
jgi:hypothetical protein